MHEAAKVALEKAGFTIEKLQNHIKELEAENEKLKDYSTCDGCTFKPNQGENYYEPCGECSRFYSDQYITKAP